MKIIGNTVGMGLPKPNLMQTDPTKGDYVKGKEEFVKQFSGEDVDLTGYATEQFVRDGFQPKGNYLAESALPTAIDTALAQAKASGEFDGKDGIDGKDGQDGYTPQKNVDYFDGKDGKDGSNGKDGTSATHSWNNTILTITSASGTSSADLKGAKGDKGDKGDTGAQGIQGIQGIPGEKGEKGDTGATGAQGNPGKDGANGKDGTSVTHSWSGTTLSVTSASGTSSANLKGEKGDKGDKGDSIKGDKGDTGAAGTSVTVKSVSESTADGGSNVVTFSDGKTLTIKNGSKGSAGANGTNGKTPVKGVDYFTAADQEAIVQQVIAALGTPVFGRVDADNNIILTGELVDGTYTLKYEDAEGDQTVIGELALGGITNLADPTSAEWLENKRINSSGSIVDAYAGSVVTNYIPCKAGDVVRVKGMDIAYYQSGPTDVGRTGIFYYQSDKAVVGERVVVADNPNIFVNSGDVWTFTVGNGGSGDTSKIAYTRPFGRYMSGYTKNDVIITVNEEIV